MFNATFHYILDESRMKFPSNENIFREMGPEQYGCYNTRCVHHTASNTLVIEFLVIYFVQGQTISRANERQAMHSAQNVALMPIAFKHLQFRFLIPHPYSNIYKSKTRLKVPYYKSIVQYTSFYESQRDKLSRIHHEFYKREVALLEMTVKYT